MFKPSFRAVLLALLLIACAGVFLYGCNGDDNNDDTLDKLKDAASGQTVQLHGDITVQGDLQLRAVNIDLNGHKLKVSGKLTIQDFTYIGTASVTGGSIESNSFTIDTPYTQWGIHAEITASSVLLRVSPQDSSGFFAKVSAQSVKLGYGYVRFSNAQIAELTLQPGNLPSGGTAAVRAEVAGSSTEIGSAVITNPSGANYQVQLDIIAGQWQKLEVKSFTATGSAARINVLGGSVALADADEAAKTGGALTFVVSGGTVAANNINAPQSPDDDPAYELKVSLKHTGQLEPENPLAGGGTVVIRHYVNRTEQQPDLSITVTSAPGYRYQPKAEDFEWLLEESGDASELLDLLEGLASSNSSLKNIVISLGFKSGIVSIKVSVTAETPMGDLALPAYEEEIDIMSQLYDSGIITEEMTSEQKAEALFEFFGFETMLSDEQRQAVLSALTQLFDGSDVSAYSAFLPLAQSLDGELGGNDFENLIAQLDAAGADGDYSALTPIPEKQIDTEDTQINISFLRV